MMKNKPAAKPKPKYVAPVPKPKARAKSVAFVEDNEDWKRSDKSFDNNEIGEPAR